MADIPCKLPRLGFAGFEDSVAAAGGTRRKRRWQLYPTKEPGAGAAVDAARLLNENEIMEGLGRKAEK